MRGEDSAPWTFVTLILRAVDLIFQFKDVIEKQYFHRIDNGNRKYVKGTTTEPKNITQKKTSIGYSTQRENRAPKGRPQMAREYKC